VVFNVNTAQVLPARHLGKEAVDQGKVAEALEWYLPRFVDQVLCEIGLRGVATARPSWTVAQPPALVAAGSLFSTEHLRHKHL
jgi:hypothetical protein